MPPLIRWWSHRRARRPVPAEPQPTAYPRGTLREAILLAGAKPFKTPEEIVGRVGTGKFKKEQIVRCYSVVANPKHPFNKGVSGQRKAADGATTLVALKPSPTAA